MKNIRKKLIFSPEKNHKFYEEILSKTASLQNYDLKLNKELNKLSNEVIKSSPNHHFFSPRPVSKFIQHNIDNLREIKNEFIIYDQQLLKVTEGFHLNYIPRYCRITDKSFQYFKNEIKALKIFNNPLISIPLSLIDQVRIVNFKPPIDKSHYFFEVLSQELQRMKTKILPSNFQNGEDAPNKDSSHHRKMTKSVDYTSSKRSFNINPSHMMREVFPGFDEEDLNMEKSQSDKPIFFKGIHFKTREELTNYRLFKKEKSANFLNPIIIDLMRQRKVSNSLKYDYNWTYREIEWYLGEKNFIFAVDNVKDLKKWVLLLNWVLSYQKSK